MFKNFMLLVGVTAMVVIIGYELYALDAILDIVQKIAAG